MMSTSESGNLLNNCRVKVTLFGYYFKTSLLRLSLFREKTILKRSNKLIPPSYCKKRENIHISAFNLWKNHHK